MEYKSNNGKFETSHSSGTYLLTRPLADSMQDKSSFRVPAAADRTPLS